MKRLLSFVLIISLLLLCACSNEEETGVISVPSIEEGSVPENLSTADTSGMDFSLTNRDQENSVDESEVSEAEKTDEGYHITTEGTYILSGDITDQMVLVEAGDTDKIQIVLDKVNLQNSKGPAIYIKSADKVFITAKDGTENTISDGNGYSYVDETDIDAAIFSRADLTINGTGKLTVNGNTKHGICSKDDLVVSSLSLNVNSQNVGLNGKDCVKLSQCSITVNSGTDGIRSDNAEDTDRGFVYIESGDLSITSANDGIQAETAIKITDGNITIVSGGGSGNGLTASSESAKGIKAASDILIDGGTFDIQSMDDCIHSNNTISITNGAFALSSGDDGIHADTDLSISGGNINISKSYEGIEGSRIFVTGGNIALVASDDGLNAAGGNDNSAMGGRPGMGGFSNGVGEIYITGGYLYVNASGDGIDSNGTIAVSGGVTLVSGPTNSGNGAFDFDGSAAVTGGVLIATGAVGMAQNFTQAENQGAMLINVSGNAKQSFAVCDEKGNVIVSFAPEKSYQCAVITAPEIQQGGSYKIITGAEIANADSHGFAQNSAYTGGTESYAITMDSLIYSASGGMGGTPGFGGGHQKPSGGMGRPF